MHKKCLFFISFMLFYSSCAFSKPYLCRYGLLRRGPWFDNRDRKSIKIQPINHSNPSVWPIGNQTTDSFDRVSGVK